MTNLTDNAIEVITPHWPAAAGVHVYSSTRQGGISQTPYNSMNLGLHVNDDELHVRRNREILQQHLNMPSTPRWLNQVHGTDVCTDQQPTHSADAACTATSGQVLAIMTADCLPVVIATATSSGNTDIPRCVAAAHAGWRSLVGGVLQNTIEQMAVDPASLCAWLGPAIGPAAFEVGDEVREEFLAKMPGCESAFVAGKPGKWFADLYLLAGQVLTESGIEHISGGDYCTHSDPRRFYSHRRDGPATGRMATFAWID